MLFNVLYEEKSLERSDRTYHTLTALGDDVKISGLYVEDGDFDTAVGSFKESIISHYQNTHEIELKFPEIELTLIHNNNKATPK